MAVISGSNSILPDTRRGSVYLSALVKTSYGTSGETAAITGTDKFTSCIIQILIANISGGSPTLNVYLQQQAADQSSWYDIASMTQITANGNYIQSFVGGSAVGFTGTDKSLAAGSTKAVPVGGRQRLAFVYGGSMTSDITATIEYIQ